MMNKRTISKYKIVYEDSPISFELAAKVLKEGISSLCGAEIECAAGVPSGEYEIAIVRKAPLMSYAISVEESKVTLACGGGYSADCAVKAFLALLAEGDVCDGVAKEEVLLSLEREPLSEGADLRVMTSNILAERWLCGGRPTLIIRAEIYTAILAKYAPDLVGVQETDMPWAELFPAYLEILRSEYGIDYSWDQSIVDDVANLTSILYLRGRFSMKEHGMRDFSYFTHVKYKLRVLTWAVFKDEKTGELCSLVNTHWSGNKEHSVLEIKEENALVKDIEARYEGIDVFCTGDFNMHGNYAFEPMKAGTGLTDAKEAADAAGTLVNRLSGIGVDIYIDHVFFNNPLSVTRYETVENPPAHTLSDHLPQYGDFKL